MPDIYEVMIYTVSSFVVLFILSKLLGKKQIAQMDFADYVIGISIGSIAGNMATDLSAPFYHYIIAMVGFFIFDIVINLIGRKDPFLKKIMHGQPTTIVYDGKIIYENLKKNRMDVNEFLSMCRAKDYFDIKDVYYAVLETSGELSIIPTAKERPLVALDLVNVDSKVIKNPSLPNYLVCDGVISYSGLNELDKDEAWLKEKLNINSKKDLKNIILASYNEETQSFDVHCKDNG